MGYLKFFVKVHLVGQLRQILITVARVRPNKAGWEDRLLIINLELLGDLVSFTSVLKHYKASFPGKRIYFLMNGETGFPPSALAPFVDDIVTVALGRFKKDPWYGARLIMQLRRIGFRTVIDQDPSLVDVLGRSIAVSLGSEEIIGYEGFLIDIVKPSSKNAELGLWYVKKHIMPRFTKVIPAIKVETSEKRLPNYIRYFAAIFEGATGRKELDYSTTLVLADEDRKKVDAILREHNIKRGHYATLALGAGTGSHRGWGPEKFAALATLLQKRNIFIVLVGVQGDRPLADRFRARYKGLYLDLVGQTSVGEFMSLIDGAMLSVSNDSGAVHIAVALKKPSLAILPIAHFGRHSLYGYRNINRWVYNADQPCLCDNWHCVSLVKKGDPVPCIASISVEQATGELEALLEYLGSGQGTPQRFEVEFE